MLLNYLTFYTPIRETLAFMSFYVHLSVLTDMVFFCYVKSFTHEERRAKATFYTLYYCLLLVSCNTVITTKSVGNVKDNSVDTSAQCRHLRISYLVITELSGCNGFGPFRI